MTKNPTIKTPHLTLRPLQPIDATTLHRIYQSEGVLRYFPSPKPPCVTRRTEEIESKKVTIYRLQLLRGRSETTLEKELP